MDAKQLTLMHVLSESSKNDNVECRSTPSSALKKS